MFFVISGFCIHIPYASGAAPQPLSFIIRRYTRIGIPTLAAVFLSILFLGEITTMWRLLLWSLYCEIVYYTVYPLLFKIRARGSWMPILAISVVFCVILTWLSGSRGMYARMDLWDPLLGLPCWILGCILAERFRGGSDSSTSSSIWLWRLGAWASGSLCYGLMLHTPLGFRVTLPFFAIYSYFWLQAELRHRTPDSRLSHTLELFGAASFSLYLTHPLAEKIWKQTFPTLSDATPSFVGWAFRLIIIFLFAAIFYLLVERPSHQLAKRIVCPQKAHE